MNRAALIALADAADALARLARAAVEDHADDADALVPIATAAIHAKCSGRTLTAARRAGELPMFGRQRSRTVRRSDLEAWIESRRVAPVAGPDDLDMQRRMARLRRTA
jgi:hypothetical protein